MERKTKRTVISIQEHQPELDFEEAEHNPPFTFPEYQREILGARIVAGMTDFGIVALMYSVFVVATIFQMPESAPFDRKVFGIYAVGYFVLVATYYLLFMLSASQTPGMKAEHLIAVGKEGVPLAPWQAGVRGFGYLISILPVMLGFLWALVDPEHLTWADKVSGTYVKRAGVE